MTPKLFLILLGLSALALLSIPAVHLVQKALGVSSESKEQANSSPSPSQSSRSESFGSSSSSSLSLSPTFNEQIRNRHNLDAVSSQELLNSGHVTETSPSISDNSAATTADRLETQSHITDTKTGMVIDAGAGNTLDQTDQQQQKEKFFMVMKLHKSFDFYQVSNITTNMKNFNQGDNKVEYNLKDGTMRVDDSGIIWSQSFKIIDTTSTPNVIKMREGSIGLNSITMDYEKQYNTLTKTTTYTGKSSLIIDSGAGAGQEAAVQDLSLKAVIYPNMTGTLEILTSRKVNYQVF
jgi:hypothetical protein